MRRLDGQDRRDQDARRHEQLVQQLQAELRQANQTLIVKQNEITQLNKDNARLVAKAGAAAKRSREQQAHGEQLQTALHRALADDSAVAGKIFSSTSKPSRGPRPRVERVAHSNSSASGV